MVRPMRRSERGTIMIVTAILIFVLAGMSAALLSVGVATARATEEKVSRFRAFEIAEAGAAAVIAQVQSGNGPVISGTTTNGPVSFQGGTFTTTTTATIGGPGAELITVNSVGDFSGSRETVTVEFSREPPTINESFLKAVYAGNAAEVNPDGTYPNQFQYQLSFGGGVDAMDSNTAFDGDLVEGDVYAGGDIMRNQQARLNGEVKGLGNLMLGVAGASNHTAVRTSTPVLPPNLAAMNYSQIADIDVAQNFGSRTSGTLSSSDPAHIFTKNPSDRSSLTSGTAKNDYFLEDLGDGTRAWADPITPSADGNNKIYYVDGNVWINNFSTIQFQWAAGTKITIVAKGNIYIGDDVRYPDNSTMVAFIALKDSSVADSGNIVLGDPRFGTVDFMDGVMYAENDFKDSNLTSQGAAHFEILGGMLAGNRVAINRDYAVNSAHWEWVPSLGRNVWVPRGQYHSEMTVRFDQRLTDPSFVKPPGLPPASPGGPAGAWQALCWRRGL